MADLILLVVLVLATRFYSHHKGGGSFTVFLFSTFVSSTCLLVLSISDCFVSIVQVGFDWTKSFPVALLFWAVCLPAY